MSSFTNNTQIMNNAKDCILANTIVPNFSVGTFSSCLFFLLLRIDRVMTEISNTMRRQAVIDAITVKNMNLGTICCVCCCGSGSSASWSPRSKISLQTVDESPSMRSE